MIGYERDVILPLRIVPENPRKAVTLRLKLDYGICEKLCIPVEAKMELSLSGDTGTYEVALETAEARVPMPVAIGKGTKLAIRSVRREVGSTAPRIIIDVAAPGASVVDLFVEGPTSNWALPLPKPIAAPDGLWRFALELTGAPSDSTPEGSVLKFTAVSDDEAIEVSTSAY